MVAPRRRRCAVDAGQVGIPMVRRLGHGIPLRDVRDDRSGVREGSAAAAHARVVHASERAYPCLRMGVRGLQSAGARVGGDPRLPDRGKDVRPQGSRIPRADLPEALDQLHMVGEPQGRRGQQHLRGRVPGPRQYRRVRPDLRLAVRGPAGPGRRHELDGDVLPQHARHCARAREGRRRLRGRRHQVLRAFRLHRRSRQPDGRPGGRPLA